MNSSIQEFRKYPSERLQIMFLFLEKPNDLFTSSDVSKHLGLNDNQGKNSGGILSAIYRGKIQGEHLIIPLMPEMGARRMKWILNKTALSQQLRTSVKQAIVEVLTERQKLIKKL